MGRFDESLAWYERALEIDPRFSWGHALIGSHDWTVLGRLDEAVVWRTKAVALDPGSPWSYAALDRLLLDPGDSESAGDAIHHAMGLGPEIFGSNVAMQTLAMYRGDEVAAFGHGRRAFAIWPLEDSVLTLLRGEEVRAGRYAEARALYEDLFPELLSEREPAIDPRNYLAAIDLALVVSRTGEPDRAAWLLDQSLQQIRRGPRLGCYYGYGIADAQIHAQRGETRKGLSALREAIDAGWRAGWWLRKPDFESLRDEPEFQAMVEEIRADMAAQLAHLREKERRGELVFPAQQPVPSTHAADTSTADSR